MYSSEYAAYKHLVESEKENLKSAPLQNLNNLRECPRYLYPVKQKKIIECNLQLNQASYTDDFILLSEFSEIEGPKPLFTIPTDGGCNFNKNDYSLHVMCVDFHTTQQQQKNLSNTLISNGLTSRFSLTKDTSLINYWDLCSNGISAYVHHFTLYDIEARGFVRPFCLTYITYDREKVQVYFNNYVQIFTKITDIFKRSNLNLFKRHLDEHMKNLYYTREKFLLWTNLIKTQFQNDSERSELLNKYDIDHRADIKFSKFNSQTLNNLINEIETVLDLIKSELESKNWYESDKPNDEFINKLLGRNCESNIDEIKQIATNDGFRSSSCPLNGSGEASYIVNNNKPKLILDLHGSISYSFNFNVNNPAKNLLQNKVMKNIYQLAPTTARLAFKKLRLVHKFYSKPTYLLKFSDLEQKYRPTNNKIWYFLLGNCVISDQSYKIDINQLNQYMLRRNTSNDELKYYSINDVSCSSFYTPLNQTYADIDDIEDDFTSIISDDELNSSLTHENDYDFVNSIIFNKNTQQAPNIKQISEKLVEINEFDFDSILRTYLYKKFSNSFVHILYSLLKGRPLVIITRSKLSENFDKLNMLINCLYNFIPNNYSNSRNVMIYDSRPVKLIDLKILKIIGLVLNNYQSGDEILLKYIPITIRNYVSILDLDNLKFTGPKYDGTYLVNLCNKLKHFSNDSIFYLYFLKNFTYFYLNLMFILQNSVRFSREANIEEYFEFSKKFFSSSAYCNNVSVSDLNIICYLIKSFKLRQIYLCQSEKSEFSDGQFEMPLAVEYEQLTSFQS